MFSELDTSYIDTPGQHFVYSEPKDPESAARHALANSNQVLIYLRQLAASHLTSLDMDLPKTLEASVLEIKALRALMATSPAT